MNKRKIKCGLELARSLLFMIGSILFITAAIGFIHDPNNHYSNYVYLGCAIAYTGGSMADLGTYIFQERN